MNAAFGCLHRLFGRHRDKGRLKITCPKFRGARFNLHVGQLHSRFAINFPF